jgi:emfourin
VRVQIKRRGGIAGVILYADLATTELDDETAARVEQAVDRLIDQPPAPSQPEPDRFYYEITLPNRGRSVSVAEHELPNDMRPLIEMLSKVGTVGSAGNRRCRPDR